MTDIDKLLESFDKYTNLLAKTQQKLDNPNFVSKAKPELVEKEKKALEEFKQQEERAIKTIDDMLLKFFESEERLFWHIQFSREKRITLEEYGNEWFDEYLKPAEKIDKINLLNDVKDFIR